MADDVEIGRKIAGRYVIEARLGAGGMGVVARARDERLDRLVALKLLSQESVGDGIARARLIREARSAAALDHPGIVHVYDVGETDDGGAFLVMELVRGESFAARIASHSMSRTGEMHTLLEVARTLGEAHRRGFVHRDVKPENIMIREDGRPVLLDFGLAKSAATPGVAASASHPDLTAASAPTSAKLTSDGMIVGTPAYLAPEQAFGTPVDGRADQFSLAVIAYEVLVGRSPWNGTNVRAVLSDVLTADPPAPSSVAPDLSPALDAVLLRALSKEPSKRFPTIEAFADALAAVPLASDPGAPRSFSHEVFAPTVASAPALTPNSGTSPMHSSAPPIVSTIIRGAKQTLGRPRLRLATIAVALTLAVIAGGSKRIARWRRDRARGDAAGSVLASERSVLACPIIEVRGVPEPSGWLGAATADFVCTRASLLLGGDVTRTMGPAELLSLPTHPGDGIGPEVFAAPDARARTMDAARARADAWIDGTVAIVDGAFRIVLSLHERDGREIVRHVDGARDDSRHEGSERALYQAARAALKLLVGPGMIPRVVDLDAEVARWTHVRTVHAASGLLNYTLGLHGADSGEECARPESRDRDLPGHEVLYRPACAQQQLQIVPSPTWLPVDRSSSAAFAFTTFAYNDSDSPDAYRALAAEAHERLGQESSRIGRARLARSESRLWLHGDETGRAREAALVAIQNGPRDEVSWELLERASPTHEEALAAARARVAWTPQNAMSWLALSEAADDATQQRQFAEYANTILPGSPQVSMRLGELLIDSDSVDRAIALADSLAEGTPAARGVSVWLRTRIATHAGHLAAALDRARGALLAATAFGFRANGDFELLAIARELAVLFDQAPAFADAFATRFVLTQPLKLSPYDPHVAADVAATCALASESIATRCFDRLRELHAARLFRGEPSWVNAFIAGAQALARHDSAAAAQAWRPIVGGPSRVWSQYAIVMAPTFALGEPALAERVDAWALAHSHVLAGVSFAHLRAIERARSSDPQRAQRLSREVLAAIGARDVDLPALSSIRRIGTTGATP